VISASVSIGTNNLFSLKSLLVVCEKVCQQKKRRNPKATHFRTDKLRTLEFFKDEIGARGGRNIAS